MGSIKFVKEPGYTYNLFWLFTLYFNKEKFLRPREGYKNSEEDMEYLRKVLDDFSPISDDLLVFFYIVKNNASFMHQNYILEYKKAQIQGDFNLEMVLNALNDHEQVISKLLRFYFSDISEEQLQECRISLSAVNKLIKESGYSGDVKSALYAFFIEPVPIIQKLCDELMVKEAQIAVLYEKKYKDIIELQNKLSYERIISDVRKNSRIAQDLSQYDEIYVSIGMLVRGNATLMYCKNTVIVLIGLDYEDFFEYYMLGNLPVNLDAFGTAISEKNRIEILELALKNKEITQKDIQKELNMTPTNTFYHVSLMIKANVLKVRPQGRTIFYSINKEHIKDIINAISRYVK